LGQPYGSHRVRIAKELRLVIGKGEGLAAGGNMWKLSFLVGG